MKELSISAIGNAIVITALGSITLLFLVRCIVSAVMRLLEKMRLL